MCGVKVVLGVMLRYPWPLFPIDLEIEIKGSAVSFEIGDCFVFSWRFGFGFDQFSILLFYVFNFQFFQFFFQMEQKTGLFGLDQFTISLICGVSVLSLVLVIVSLGIIGFFIKVRVQPFFCLSQISPNNFYFRLSKQGKSP